MTDKRTIKSAISLEDLVAELEAIAVAELEPAPCDQCGALAELRHMLSAWVWSHEPWRGRAVPARVNSGRWWGFCGGACREAWWLAPASEPFHPLGVLEGFLPTDRLLRMGVWHVESLSGEVRADLASEHRFPDGPALNLWWRSAD